MLTLVSNFLTQGQVGRPGQKVQLLNFESLLEDQQKRFISKLKEKGRLEILNFIEKTETFNQSKDISEVD